MTLFARLSRNRVAKNTLVVVLAQVFSRLITVFYVASLARYIGPDGVGKISIASALNGLLILIVGPGLETLLVRDVAADRDKAATYLTHTIFIRLGLGLPFIVITALTARLAGYPHDTVMVAQIFTLVYLLDAVSALLIAVFQAYEAMEYEALGTVGRDVLNVGLSLLAIYLKQSLLVIAAISAVASLGKVILLAAFLRRRALQPRWHISLHLSRSLLVTGAPFSMLMILHVVQLQAGTLVLSLFYSADDVGVYAVASGLITMLLMLPRTFEASIFPVFSRLHRHAPHKLPGFYQLCFRALLIVGFPLGLGTILVADRLIGLVYGPEFDDAVLILQVLALRLFIFVGYSNGPLLNATGRQRFFAWTQAIGVAINVVAVLVMVPLWGALGAALAFVVSGAFTFVVHSLASHRQFDLTLPWGTAGRVALATALMGTATWLWLRADLPWLIAVFAVAPVVYGAAILLLGAIERDELTLLAAAPTIDSALDGALESSREGVEVEPGPAAAR